MVNWPNDKVECAQTEFKFNAEKFRENLAARLRRQYGKDISQANEHDLFDAVSASVQELILPAWMATRREYDKKPRKQLFYLSAEFLMGRALSNNLINLGIKEENILLGNACTSCKNDTLYSYRKESGTSNRMIAAISLS